MKKLYFFLSLIGMFTLSVGLAQQKSVSGTILDESGGPLPGATVLVEGTNRGIASDFDGNFSIQASEGEVLIVSYIGYADQRVLVGGQDSFIVTLNQDNTFDEVVVIAYGINTKEGFTGSASVIGAEDLAIRNVTSPIAAIEGRATGVQFTSAQGPGSSPGIVIRVVGTLNGDTDPLFIVDDIEYEGELNTINQEDIASFTILKDAASTSLYGSRAANGVVIITTKSGANGGIKVNASVQHGVISPSIDFYPELTPGQYHETM
jgi:TonB-dependent SusC/RagA subfamily outer membrane receptor